MKIHEYQGKQILREYGVPVPRGIPAFSVEEAVRAAEELGGSVWVVKAQIHAGGRGKGGGVKVAKSIAEVREKASQILGMQLVTHQTSPEGQKVRRLLIEEGADIKKELYVSMVVDRASQRVALLASSEGGMDIEEVAHKNPEAIKKVFIDPAAGLTDAQCDDVARAIGIPDGGLGDARKALKGLYAAFVEKDASLAEINPLIVTGNGRVVALDAKFNFDANGLFRHPDIVAMRDLDEEDPAEIEASKYDLAYISLDGDIGCLVNGAGLAMATMDTIKLYGGAPANFLDVGGGATTEKVTEAFKIMLKNPNLKAILVNIFGGIMKCDTIAEGVVAASKAVGLKVPLVVRMKGTNEDLGKEILAKSGLPIITANNMAEAAEKVVAAASGAAPDTVRAAAPVAAAAAGAVTAAAAAKAPSAAAAGGTPALAPSAPAAGWLKWLAFIVCVLLAAGALRLWNQNSAEAPKVEAVKPAPAAAAQPVAPAFGKWAAALADGKLTLEGAVNDQGAKDGLLAAAKGVFGDGNVVDKLTLDAAQPKFAFAGKWADVFEWIKQRALGLAFDGGNVRVNGELGEALIPQALAALKGALGDQANIANDIKAKAMAAADAFKAGAKTFRIEVEFDTGSAKIRADGARDLDGLAELLKDGKTHGEVGGHTDNVGQPEDNLKLSQQRADAVVAYLATKGVPKEALTSRGYGDTKPVADNATEEGRQKNRRVEFVVQ